VVLITCRWWRKSRKQFNMNSFGLVIQLIDSVVITVKVMLCQMRSRRMLNWKGYGKKWTWPILRQLSDIFIKELWKVR
jgi:hypothetical protein